MQLEAVCTSYPCTFALDADVTARLQTLAACSGVSFDAAVPIISGFQVDAPSNTKFAGVTLGFTSWTWDTSAQTLNYSLTIGLANTPGGAVDPSTWKVHGEILAVKYPKSVFQGHSIGCTAASSTCNRTVNIANGVPATFKYVGDGITKIVLNANSNGQGFVLTDLRVKALWNQVAQTRDLVLQQTCTASPATNVTCTVDSVVMGAYIPVPPATNEMAPLATVQSHSPLTGLYYGSFGVNSPPYPKAYFCNMRGFELLMLDAPREFVTLSAGARSWHECQAAPSGGPWAGHDIAGFFAGTVDPYSVANYLNGTKMF